MIDIVIPTLMRSDLEVFNYSLIEANESEVVNTIFIIDNTGQQLFQSNLPKVQILSMDKNIYVNPAWNLGVSLSNTDNVLIMNDDIACSRNNYNYVDELLNTDDCGLCSIKSMRINCLEDYTSKQHDIPPKIATSEIFENPDNNKTGWFFGIKRRLWKNIPSPIKVIYGDDLMYLRVRKLGYSTKNIVNTSIGHLESKTINQVMDQILTQINRDIVEYHNFRTFYLENG